MPSIFNQLSVEFVGIFNALKAIIIDINANIMTLTRSNAISMNQPAPGTNDSNYDVPAGHRGPLHLLRLRLRRQHHLRGAHGARDPRRDFLLAGNFEDIASAFPRCSRQKFSFHITIVLFRTQQTNICISRPNKIVPLAAWNKCRNKSSSPQNCQRYVWTKWSSSAVSLRRK